MKMKYIEELEISNITGRAVDAYEPSEEEVEKLTASIKEVGLIHPIVVMPVNGHYELVTGEVRKRAMERLDHKTIPAVVKGMTKEECRQLIAAENCCRRGQAPITVAEQMKALNVEGDSLRDIGRAMGCSYQTVADYLKLMEAPKEIQKYLQEQKLGIKATVAVVKELNKAAGDLDEEQLQNAKAKAWSHVRKQLNDGKSPSATEARAIVQKALPAKAASTDPEEINDEPDVPSDTVEPDSPEADGQPNLALDDSYCGVLSMVVEKNALVQAFAVKDMRKKKIEFQVNDRMMSGPVNQCVLKESATVDCTFHLHRDYVMGISHMLSCPETDCNNLMLHMRVTGHYLTIEAKDQNCDLMFRVPAKLELEQDEQTDQAA
jgi:ParB/RepB/Spo0J family partition protein